MLPRLLLRLSLLAVLLAACTPQASAPTLDVNALSTQAYQTALAALQPTST
ncbi:MAG: hypothetical protein HRF47_19185, partial [Chloroflexota bacterium]